ncbi:MAG: response regulator transcription factor [Nitrosomonas sp.]|uniref:response regulator transcription factor n=1 Tax=Nitrosomonas sp. TaxID=42353 RepID=UPI0027283B97|nr:response regulator transcription factor [Nitrosomonas sp.]MDO8893444.1 response regulator transcription factor [Nitrosomonas sp.]MDO9469682.1 response regulator transcription factor [Nitrosomonas sp.]MDP1551226.1 response regulator transcription factor [Nitrosomonas sp.]MDP1788585.1 response regulator transcription factor [Nitrosomonas sp.]MDP1933321.1 response regulator transcription factor [Nitrosomonas sp.]
MNNTLILVIEDEKALRENISEIIAHYGFRVISTPTGEEGLTMALEYIPDIIICDIMLPGIDGFEVFARIKQLPQLSSTAFMFLTAKSTRSDTRIGMNMGADDYLTKPFTKEELVNSIRARLEKLSKKNKHQLEKDELIEAALEKMTSLTKAERKVLNAISEGYTTPQIAQKLFVSKKTIENHRVNISRKLNLSGPNSLISFALRLRMQHSNDHSPDSQIPPASN